MRRDEVLPALGMPDPADAELLARCRLRDREAWALLLERHGSAILGAFRTRLRGLPGSAGDRAQDLFQDFWLHPSGGRGAEAPAL